MTTTKDATNTALTSAAALPLAASDEDLGDGIHVVRSVDGVAVLNKKRNVGLTVFLVGFSVIWNTIVAVVGSAGVLPLFGVPHVLGGLFVTAWAANELLNHTRIDLGHGRLAARRRPLPWPGRIDLALDDVDHFFVAPGKVQQNRQPLPALWVATTDGAHHIVLSVLPHTSHGERLAAVLGAHVDAVRARG